MSDLAKYPSLLPPIGRDQITLKPIDTVLRTDMDNGLSRARRRYRSAPTVYQVAWTFTLAQFAIFEGWFDAVISGGAAWFEIDLPDHNGISTLQARFLEAPSTARRGAQAWNVSGQLLVTGRDYSSALLTEANEALTTEAGDPLYLE